MHSPEFPFNLSMTVPTGAQLHSFCYAFILAHHNKRMQRSKASQIPESVGVADRVEEDEVAPVSQDRTCETSW